MHSHDPSWCARINAAPEPPRPAPPPPPQPAFVYRAVPTQHVCEICGTVMYDHHCKIICPTCGYKRDCSDP